MSTYEYTDHYKVTLDVSPSIPNADYVTLRATREFTDSAPRVFVATEDAPALALAILEAAGIKPSLTAQLDCPEHYERRALAHLETARKLRDRKAEREAEDAKVRAFRDAIMPHAPVAWEDLHEGAVEEHRDRYRAAREFFAREEIIPAEVVEPRTVPNVEYLGPEHRASDWQDSAGCFWDYADGRWRWRSRLDATCRVSDPEGFPWTEVL